MEEGSCSDGFLLVRRLLPAVVLVCVVAQYAALSTSAGAPPRTIPVTVDATALKPPRALAQPWFNLLPDVVAAWNLQADPSDAMRFTLTPKHQPAAGKPKQVLILFAVKSPLFDAMLSAVCSTFLTDGVPVVFTLAYFKSSNALGLADLKQAVSSHTDLILSAGSATTAFIQSNFRGGPIPVVTIMSKDPVLLGQTPSYGAGSGSNIAYTSVNVPIDVQVTYLLQLKPHLTNIAILSSDDDLSARTTQVTPLEKAARKLGVHVLDVAVTDEQQARGQLTRSVPDSVAWMKRNDPRLQNSVFWITASTAVIDNLSTVDRYADHAPVLSVYPELVRAGEDSATLSIGVSFSTASRMAAHYAVLILRGEATPGKLIVGTISPPDIAINFLKAQECGLKIPFQFFESATFVYDDFGRLVRRSGSPVTPAKAA